MTFGQIIHYVPHSNAWPEPVRGIAFLLSPLHSADPPTFQDCPASNPPESSSTPAAPPTRSYTAIDFQHLIHSTATDLNALTELPHYGGARSTVPIWSQLIHALANTLSTDVLILEDTPFVMPRAQDVATQPSDLVDGHATLIAAHVIYSTPKTHSDRSSTNSGSGDYEDELMYSADSSRRVHSDRSRTSSGSRDGEDVSMYSADSDSCNGSLTLDSLDGLDLPLQAHILPGRGRWHYAVLPVLLVADSQNIVPLLCTTLYQRRVWGVREPVVGLCCSNTGTTATAIFGWLDSHQSEEGRMPVAHLALAGGDSLDPSMGVFDFTDSCSAIPMAQFVLRLRSHFQDIKDITSIEAVSSLTSFHWRSDLPDFESQMGGQLEDRVAAWTHQVHVHTGSSEISSSGPRTPSPLSNPVIFLSTEQMSPQDLETIHEDAVGGSKASAPRSTLAAGKTKPGSSSRPPTSKNASQRSSERSHKKSSSRLSNSVFAAKSDVGLVGEVNISSWLFERNAFTVGRIPIPLDSPLAEESGVSEMITIYDAVTAFTWSDVVRPTLSKFNIDSSVLGVRDELFEKYGENEPSTTAITMPSEDIAFISTRLSALLHAVQGARDCEGIAALHGANEAERRHEWDALLLQFFRPVPGQRDILLERQLNFARNLVVRDNSFPQRATSLAEYYEKFCSAQRFSEYLPSDDIALRKQAIAAVEHASQLTTDTMSRASEKFLEDIVDHSRMEPVTGTSDAVLVIQCSGATTAMLKYIHESKDPQVEFLKTFILVHGKPDKQDVTLTPPTNERLQASWASSLASASEHQKKQEAEVPLQASSSHVSERQQKKERKALLQNMYLVHPDRGQITKIPSEKIPVPDSSEQDSEENALLNASGQDLLLPVLLAEYKKKDQSTIAKAMNQMRTYLVSALRFLAALDITEQPVFGLVVNGRLGAVAMAWQKNEKIYIMERNVRHYDISDPLQAFQFVSVLLRLARHGLVLRDRLEQMEDAVYKRFLESGWSKLAQIKEGYETR
ncbi:hypothetical protein K503DRAFT_717925 [Rhizopogon vinicolor AM-OR11-026]|uniref:Uncharacterized protein n=1 Tax=Rhizopogon vinicolor AM-OR11-026 TaxID=1314800 RepID=A0A1B7N186_9AGAM|nr:hypothetical protein K503DRAFT_717925 [Rhizopogon vinicolor AM-OR11-026]